MSISFTEEGKYPLLDDGSRNWGAVINGILTALDQGFMVTFEAGEALKKHDVVCLKTTDVKMYKADNDDLTLLPPIGLVVTDVASGDNGKVVAFGWADFEASWAVAASLSYTVNDLIYVDSTAGRITSTRPQNANLLGRVKEDTDASFITKMFIHPPFDRNLITQKESIAIENLAADGDIANRPIFVSPTAIEIISLGVLSQGTPAGIDDSNTSVLTIADDASNTIVTKTYNSGTAFPTNDYEDLGSLDSTHKILDAGEHLLLSHTNGTTADPPAYLIIIEYRLRV